MSDRPAGILRLVGLHSALAGPFELSVAKGECVAITGHSGSGKSLFLRMVADLDPNQGEVTLDGRDRSSFSPPEWRRHVVYNAAETGWWDDQVIAHFPAPTRSAARALGAGLGLDPEVWDGPVLRLSTGERQRLALIRTLMLEPPVLLLDEPTGALDASSTDLVEAVLRQRLAAGTAILMVTHSAEQAGRLGDRHFQMANRRLVPA